MSEKTRKTEPPLHLDMPFAEALERFVRTNPEEVAPPKGKKPKVAKAAKRLAASKQSSEPPIQRHKGRAD
jgi:hypothetical protein